MSLEFLTRWVDQLAGRIGGPMSFRLVLQPAMAVFLAIRAGRKDAKTGRPPFFWSVLNNPKERQALLASGWKDIGRVALLAVAMDAIYQVIELHWFYPLQALIVAVLLAVVPYVLVRGPVHRLTK